MSGTKVRFAALLSVAQTYKTIRSEFPDNPVKYALTLSITRMLPAGIVKVVFSFAFDDNGISAGMVPGVLTSPTGTGWVTGLATVTGPLIGTGEVVGLTTVTGVGPGGGGAPYALTARPITKQTIVANNTSFLMVAPPQ
jgi:hypothetical protein